VGAGRGSIAKWLCEKVGTTGSVVAIDIDTRLLDGIAADNLQALQLNVVDEPLPSGGFDLIHSRAVLTHLGARDVVLDKMTRALRPGGWLLLEEADGFPLTASGSEFFIKMDDADGERVDVGQEVALVVCGTWAAGHRRGRADEAL
jgi:ubiquinone/menaquinone biosynthesis C-methylase UbiE